MGYVPDGKINVHLITCNAGVDVKHLIQGDDEYVNVSFKALHEVSFHEVVKVGPNFYHYKRVFVKLDDYEIISWD